MRGRPSKADLELTEVNKAVAFSTPERTKNPAAVALGKLGGAKGGRVRAARLSPERRREIAQQAALARWAKAKVVPEEGGASTGGGSR